MKSPNTPVKCPYRAESGSAAQKNGRISFLFFLFFLVGGGMGGVRVMVPYPLNVWEMIVVPHPPSQGNLLQEIQIGGPFSPPPSPHPHPSVTPHNVTDGVCPQLRHFKILIPTLNCTVHNLV